MTTNYMCTYNTNNKQQIPPTLQLQNPFNTPPSPTSTASSSPSYTLSTPKTPPISPPMSPFMPKNKTSTLKATTTSHTNRARSRSRSASRKKSKLKKKKLKLQKTATPPITHSTNKHYKNYSNSPTRSTSKYQRFIKTPKLPHIKSMKTAKSKKKKHHQRNNTTAKTFTSKKKTKYNKAQKRLKLKKKSLSERSRPKTKKNYYYYSRPDDLFDDKPLSRHRPSAHKSFHSSTLKKKKLQKKRKGKKKKTKRKKMALRPLSTRMSDKSDHHNDTDTDPDMDMNDDSMQYLQYDVEDDVVLSNISGDLHKLLTAIKQDIECIDNDDDILRDVPSIQLSRALSDATGVHNIHKPKPKTGKKRQHKTKNKTARKNVWKYRGGSTPKTSKKVTNNNTKTHKNSKKSSKKAKKKKNCKKTHMNKCKSGGDLLKENKPKTHKYKHDTKTITIHSVDNVAAVPLTHMHIRGVMSMSMEINCDTPPCDIACNMRSFFPRKINNSLNHHNHSLGNVHFTPSLPASPHVWATSNASNTPKTPQIINEHQATTHMHSHTATSPNRRNTIGFGAGKKKKSNYNSLSLSALSHYFDYHTNCETKSILAQLAGIIMELVGEPNVFTCTVSSEQGMAIRRNKLRISPIFHRGLVLSLCVYNIPQQLQHTGTGMEHMEDSYDNAVWHGDIYNDAPRDLPLDLNISSSSSEDRDDLKVACDSDGTFVDFNSSPSPQSVHNTASPEPDVVDIEDEFMDLNVYKSTPSYILTQSHTKTTNSPSDSPAPVLNEDEEVIISEAVIHKHSLRRSHSDIHLDYNYVESFRSEKHLYQESDSFDMDITSPIYFEKEIRSNTYEFASHDKSESDVTVMSYSNTTVGHHKKRSSTCEYEEKTNNNHNQANLYDLHTEDVPSTQIPSFAEGYDTNTLSNPKHSGRFAKNVTLSSAEYIKQSETAAINAHKSKAKITDYTSIPTRNYDSSQEIEYSEYDDIDYGDPGNNYNIGDDDVSKFDEFKNNQIQQLQLTFGPSINNSIPLRTIQVTTPGNKHTQVLCDINHNHSTHKINKLSPIDSTNEMHEYDAFRHLNDPEFPSYPSLTATHIHPMHPMRPQLNDYKSDTDTEDNDDMDEKSKPHRRMPTLQRKNSEKKPTLSASKSQSIRSRSNRTISATPKYTRKPALNLSMRSRKNRNRARSQTCLNFENGFFNDHVFGGNEPDLYSSVVIDNGSFLSNISMISASDYRHNNSRGDIIKFEKPFNKMVADENGNIFIGTDKYIRYITYNQSKTNNNKYGKFRKQEKLLYELKYDEHLVSLWNQDGKIYFVTMPYALQENQYTTNKLIEEWSLNLYVVENKNNVRQRSINKYEWIPPSVRDKLPYRKLKTFRWKVRGRFIDNFLSMWYDEKYETLITLAECDRLNEPQIIFLNKRNNKGLVKLKIRNNTISIHGSTNDHDDTSNNQHLLIRHKPTKTWLCCISCVDKNEQKRKFKRNFTRKHSERGQGAVDDELFGMNEKCAMDEEDECWIQFKLNRECNKITSSKIVHLPEELRRKKWLSYDGYRDCLIGINRLGIEKLLESGFERDIQLTIVPRLTKLLQEKAKDHVFNDKRMFVKRSGRNKRGRSTPSINGPFCRKRSHSQKRK